MNTFDDRGEHGPKGTAVATAAEGKPIEDIHLGQRVLTQVFASGSGEPTNAAGDPNSTSVDSSTWRDVDFDMPDGSGGDYTMQLLEPLSWISQNRTGVGGQVYLDLPELQLNGEANILSIKPCPAIAQGQGRVVLGTFQHVSNDLVDVKLIDDASPLRVTSGHMLWSIDRDGWVNAGELQVGERLATQEGISIVASVTAEVKATKVFNLDVDVDHRYFAGDSAVLAHNANACNPYIDDEIPQPGTRSTGVARAKALEVELVQKTGKGTVDWTPDEINFIQQNGRLPAGTVGHHINDVNTWPQWAGDPRNVKLVRGQPANLVEHQGNFQNSTKGPLIDRQKMLEGL